MVNENTNPNFVTQNKLNLQDAFVISSIGFFVTVAASAAVTESTMPLYTYPNTTVFTGTSDTALYSMYNGNMQLTVNQRTILTGWDISRHFVVNQTQETVTSLDQRNLADDGFYPAEPNIVLVGSKKNILQLVMPNALASITAHSRVVCIVRGILAQNVTPVN